MKEVFSRLDARWIGLVAVVVPTAAIVAWPRGPVPCDNLEFGTPALWVTHFGWAFQIAWGLPMWALFRAVHAPRAAGGVLVGASGVTGVCLLLATCGRDLRDQIDEAGIEDCIRSTE